MGDTALVLLAVALAVAAVLALRAWTRRRRRRDPSVAAIGMLADAIEAKDRSLRLHSEEVSELVGAVADRLGVDPETRERLVFGSLLHDVGKIAISERILAKPAALTREERRVIEQHPQIGHELVEDVPELDAVAPAVLHHHERWDGDGYPDGLEGEAIPLEARLVAIADAFSAMVTDRPYREGVSVERACAELERRAGTQFDPSLVRLFVDELRSRRLPT